MAEAKINESCIIGLPTCGYAYSSSRMAFIATPADEEFTLELEVLQRLLSDKGYESYIALQRLDPAKLAFCTKICSKIITSQFCIALLNSSSHKDHKEIQIPNPNVHLEYGLMLAFKKLVLPFQREGDGLAFNISPLDTILYTKGNFKDKADRAIDAAILEAGTTSRPTRALTSNATIIKYMAVRGLTVTDVSADDASALYRLGSPLGFLLLNGPEIVYFGLFDHEDSKEVMFRIKLLLQNLHQAKQKFDTETVKTLTPERVAYYHGLWDQLRVEVLISKELDKDRIQQRVHELTKDMETAPWTLLTEDDVLARIDQEYEAIGDI